MYLAVCSAVWTFEMARARVQEQRRAGRLPYVSPGRGLPHSGDKISMALCRAVSDPARYKAAQKVVLKGKPLQWFAK